MSTMVILGTNRLRDAMRQRPELRPALLMWYALVSRGRWPDLGTMRLAIPSADGIIRAGQLLVAFDLAAGEHRLIANIDFTLQILLIQRILTRAEDAASAPRW